MPKWLSSKTRNLEKLADLIEERAARLMSADGKSRSEAEYFAICSIVDELKIQPRPIDRAKAFISLMASRYADHRDEVMIYMAWKSGGIDIGPEREKAVIARHGPWGRG